LQTDGGGTGDTWLPAVNTILEEEIGDGGGTGDTWLPAVNTILEEEIGDGGGGKGGPLAVSIRQPTRQQAVSAGGVIKTTGKTASGGGKYPSTTGDGGGGKGGPG
jgi:hypothetical protein